MLFGMPQQDVFTIKLAPDLRARLAAVAHANDRTISAETREAIRRHVELPPPDQPVVLDDIRDLYEEIERSGRAEGVDPDLLAEILRVVTGCVERAQQRRLRRFAEVVYGETNIERVTPAHFNAAVKAEVERRIRVERRDGYTSIDRRQTAQ